MYVSVAPYPYLDGIAYGCVIDYYKISTTAGAGNLVAFDMLLVLVNSFLYMWGYHVGEHGCLRLETSGACLAPCVNVHCVYGFPAFVGGLGKCTRALLVDMCVGKDIVTAIARCKRYEPQALLYEVKDCAVLYGLNAPGPVAAVVIETVETWHDNAYGLL